MVGYLMTGLSVHGDKIDLEPEHGGHVGQSLKGRVRGPGVLAEEAPDSGRVAVDRTRYVCPREAGGLERIN